MKMKGNLEFTIKKGEQCLPQRSAFWNDLKEGQKFIRWEIELLPHFSAVVVRVSRVWPDRMGFDADVTYVTDYLLYNEKKSWRRDDCPVLVPMRQLTYDMIFASTWSSMRAVQQLFLNAKQSLPCDPSWDTCFVLCNSLSHVRFGCLALGIDSEGDYQKLTSKRWYSYGWYVVDTYYMSPTECSHDTSIFSRKSLIEASLYFISLSTFRRARLIHRSNLAYAKNLLTPSFVPFEDNGRWGFCNANNGFVLPCVWKDVTPFVGIHAAVKDEYGKWGVIDLNGELCVPCGEFPFA